MLHNVSALLPAFSIGSHTASTCFHTSLLTSVWLCSSLQKPRTLSALPAATHSASFHGSLLRLAKRTKLSCSGMTSPASESHQWYALTPCELGKHDRYLILQCTLFCTSLVTILFLLSLKFLIQVFFGCRDQQLSCLRLMSSQLPHCTRKLAQLSGRDAVTSQVEKLPASGMSSPPCIHLLALFSFLQSLSCIRPLAFSFLHPPFCISMVWFAQKLLSVLRFASRHVTSMSNATAQTNLTSLHCLNHACARLRAMHCHQACHA